MKDSYSFDIDEAGLDVSFQKHHDAYVRIFARLGLPAFPVVASSGAMGGGSSLEFMVPSPAGEDDVAMCPNCDYRANIERATSSLADVAPKDGPDELEKFATPGIVTIAALAKFEGGAGAIHQIKTLVMVLDGAVTLVCLGDHQLNLRSSGRPGRSTSARRRRPRPSQRSAPSRAVSAPSTSRACISSPTRRCAAGST